MYGGYVYILTNRTNGALYTGVCADIRSRMVQHKAGTGSKFCKKYGIDRLVHVEPHDGIVGAIAREKAVKKWERAWKIELIERIIPIGAICGSISTVETVARPGDGSPLSRE